MNTLRRSFIYTLLEDVKMKELDVTFQELKRTIHLVRSIFETAIFKTQDICSKKKIFCRILLMETIMS